jgi:hypothetical protein
LREQPHQSAELNKPDTDMADGGAIVLAKVGYRLVIGSPAAFGCQKNVWLALTSALLPVMRSRLNGPSFPPSSV